MINAHDNEASTTNHGGLHHSRINNPMVGQAKPQQTIIDGPTTTPQFWSVIRISQLCDNPYTWQAQNKMEALPKTFVFSDREKEPLFFSLKTSCYRVETGYIRFSKRPLTLARPVYKLPPCKARKQEERSKEKASAIWISGIEILENADFPNCRWKSGRVWRFQCSQSGTG